MIPVISDSGEARGEESLSQFNSGMKFSKLCCSVQSSPVQCSGVISTSIKIEMLVVVVKYKHCEPLSAMR